MLYLLEQIFKGVSTELPGIPGRELSVADLVLGGLAGLADLDERHCQVNEPVSVVSDAHTQFDYLNGLECGDD